jgi:hypothetical protein
MKVVWSFFVKATDDDTVINRLDKSKPRRTLGEGGQQVGSEMF